ncbi:hypothetical protein [Chitinophaga sancti]|uniref:Uncharacterized protein n=1 Tax=Chitinophaga sancti TaxID=1004 RepID=A0A1K1SGE1_9BACT|nr:hypothetical protein [Chitinophaga sancti]WQD59827.1 hypothetical protein U0033_18220 [Chitinophaga sancti]WQG88042.1 hypothetical protein SR876_24245 [Chitinophaga sancti]SFW83151.1 hypothetical protein SAMN05661012_05352 [Chitinophaga sancti]
MIELQQIKERIAAEHYRDTNSCFELRMLLMDAASTLTTRHIANLRQGKDPQVSLTLLRAFRSVRQHYFTLEKAKEGDLDCYNHTKDAVMDELTGLYQQYRGNVISLHAENSSELKIAQ